MSRYKTVLHCAFDLLLTTYYPLSRSYIPSYIQEIAASELTDYIREHFSPTKSHVRLSNQLALPVDFN